MLTEHVVILGKTWIKSCKPKGQGRFIVCEAALQPTKAVVQELGGFNPAKIEVHTRQGVQRFETVRVNNDLLCWAVA